MKGIKYLILFIISNDLFSMISKNIKILESYRFAKWTESQRSKFKMLNPEGKTDNGY